MEHPVQVKCLHIDESVRDKKSVLAIYDLILTAIHGPFKRGTSPSKQIFTPSEIEERQGKNLIKLHSTQEQLSYTFTNSFSDGYDIFLATMPDMLVVSVSNSAPIGIDVDIRSLAKIPIFAFITSVNRDLCETLVASPHSMIIRIEQATDMVARDLNAYLCNSTFLENPEQKGEFSRRIHRMYERALERRVKEKIRKKLSHG